MEQLQLAATITEFLNEALDPVGFSKMIFAKHPINEALAADVAWVTDFDALLQIAETSPGQIRFDPPK